MSKSKDKQFVTMYSNEDEEVNIKNYPYYRTIPIQSITNKQQKIMDKSNVVTESKKVTESQLERPTYKSILTHPEYESKGVYEGLPTFNLVKVEGTNVYKVDMPEYQSEDLKNLEKQLSELEEEIKKNAIIIDGQKNAIDTNELTIQEQTGQIHTNNATIQHNHHHIQQQLATFNHNTAILNGQCNQYNLNNSEIMKQQETLNTQYNQIVEYQNQIGQFQSELESYQQHLSYHGTMLTAFNTLIQNPQYFTQLMAAAASVNPDTMTDFKYYEYNTT
jgi:DNA repair exonuclease SbcCD ATPase subunit